jgi:hypothetical protein
MKKIIFFITVILITSIAATPVGENKNLLTVSMSFAKWNSKFSAVVKAIDLLKHSDIPSKIANPVIDSLLIFQEQVSEQVAKQMVDTGSKN